MTNLGIGFQHRVSALVLAAMLIGLALLVPFQMTGAGREVEQVRFEADDEIHDLMLVTNKGRLGVQQKNGNRTTLKPRPRPNGSSRR